MFVENGRYVMLDDTSKAADKAEIAVGEDSDVGELVLDSDHACHTEPKCKAAVLVWVYASFAEDVWVDHTSAKDLDPLAVITMTCIDLKAWLNKRKVRWSHTHLHIIAIVCVQKTVHRMLEVGDTDVFVDQESLYLPKRAVVCRIHVLVAVDASGDERFERSTDLVHQFCLIR